MKTSSFQFLAAGIATVGLIVGVRHFCHGDTCCAGKEKAPAPIAVTSPSKPAEMTATATIPPTDSVDPTFEGCKASCGSHSPSLREAARVQPGAALNDVVFCPISGAVFRVQEGAVKREVVGKSLYFCCAACAAYFDAHRTEVLAARGIASGGV